MEKNGEKKSVLMYIGGDFRGAIPLDGYYWFWADVFMGYLEVSALNIVE